MKTVTHEPRLFLYRADYLESQGVGTAFRRPYFVQDEFGSLVRIAIGTAHHSLSN